MLALSSSFFVTAILYASVGFGGGSTYNALLVLAEVDYRVLPSISLICNLIVVSGGALQFAKNGHIKLNRILPWIVTSVPAALIGGMIEISEAFFVGLLGVALFVSGIRMLWPQPENNFEYTRKPQTENWLLLAPLIGGALGLIAGLVGIGGGILLAPILYLLRWGNAKVIAGTCSIFIFLNSFSGLIGQATRLGNWSLLDDIGGYWLLFLAVFIGGQVGSYMGAVHLNPVIIKRVTAILILYVAAQLLLSWANM